MKKWFVLVIIASLTGICFAQAKPTKKKQPIKQEQKKEQKKPTIVKITMSMIESGHIDPGAGIPVSNVIEAIEKMITLRKGEFESTADYNARREVALTEKFLGDSTVEDTFAFVKSVGDSSRGGLKYDYNADTSEVRLYALPTSSSMNGIGEPNMTNRRPSEGLDQFDLDYKIRLSDTYQASNAYGVTVTVERTYADNLGIAANKIPFLNFKRDWSYYQNPLPAAQFNLENAKAAKELPSLKALVVIKLASPYIVYNWFSKKPTRDEPTELSVTGKYLTGSVLGIVFYSGITGNILARIPETFGKPESKPEARKEPKVSNLPY